MINEIAHNGQDKMFEDIKRILREMAHFESMAKIKMREQKHREYHTRHAFNVTQQHIKQNIRNIRTKNK